MGNSFWILVWEGWGLGLDMISPRLYEEYDAERVQRRNSFSYRTEADIAIFLKEREIEQRFKYFKVIK